MARALDDHGVRLSLGPDAGRRAWIALLGGLGYRMFHLWERRALGERHGEVRLRPRPDASS